MKICKNCYYWKNYTQGLCLLTNVGVGELWRCEKWQAKQDLASNKDACVNRNDSSVTKDRFIECVPQAP